MSIEIFRILMSPSFFNQNITFLWNLSATVIDSVGLATAGRMVIASLTSLFIITIHTTIVICYHNRNFDTNQRLLDYKQYAKDGVSFSGRWHIAGKWRSGRLGLSWRETVEQSQSLRARAALGSLSKFSSLPPIINLCTQPFRSCGLIADY